MTTCNSIRCPDDATHAVTMRVSATEGVLEFENAVAYCLDDALYFAAWLPYCYPGQYELVSITPPASELFDRN